MIDNTISKATLLHPTNGKQIIKPSKYPISDAILGVPMCPREMLNGHFRDGKSIHLRESREEAVHIPKERNAFDHRPTKYFQRAPRILNAIMDDRIADEVGNA